MEQESISTDTAVPEREPLPSGTPPEAEAAAVKPNLTVGPDDPVSWGQGILLGLQHLLSMDVYVQPFLIASIIGLTASQSSGLIRSTFLAAGIATLLQTTVLMRMPIAQGPSFIPIAAVAGIAIANGGGINGWGTAIGACLVGGILLTVLGFSGLFHRFINSFVPGVVGGTIIFCVGLSLMPTALGDIYNKAGKPLEGAILGHQVAVAAITALTMVAMAILGDHIKKGGRVLRIASVIIALAVGSGVASIWGMTDISSVSQAPWFALPQLPFLDFHFSFNLSAIITMVIIYMVLMAETTGTWLTISNVVGTKLTDKRLNRGVIGEGVGSIIAALFGATPVIGYSTNAGIVAITGIASRRVFECVGGLFVLFSLSGKLSALIAVIPTPVIGGVFAVVCGVIAMAGLQVLKRERIGQKETFVVAIPVILVMATTTGILPTAALKPLPAVVQYLVGSPIAMASVFAIALNKVLPSDLGAKRCAGTAVDAPPAG